MYLNPRLKQILASGLFFAFFGNGLTLPPAHAQEVFLPQPGVRIGLSPEFNPPILKGLKVHPDNPFRFDFILDKGDEDLSSRQSGTRDKALKSEAQRLIKYFLASLTVPEKDLWVNLSPYEKDRIVPESFGQTEMGRDLLAQDYLLKQITASLIYPEDEFGKTFWKRVYEEANKRFGTTNIPVNTFNKVWIVPEKAVVYENAQAGTAYVVESKLKVMLEEDYEALNKNSQSASSRGRSRGISTEDLSASRPQDDAHAMASDIVRQIVLPVLEKEINQGRHFVQLRQVYNSLILATWYKKKIKDSILNQVYSDRNKVSGIGYATPTRGHVPQNVSPSTLPTNPALNAKAPQGNPPNDVEAIYQQYLQAFKKGVYNYIKEETDPITQQIIPRKYFSGGVAVFGYLNKAMIETTDKATIVNEHLDHAQIIRVDMAMASKKNLPEVSTDKDLVVSVTDFDETFVNGGEHVRIFKERFGLKEPKNDTRNRIEAEGQVIERKKRSGNIVYVVARDDIGKIAEKMGWKQKRRASVDHNETLPIIDLEKDLVISKAGFSEVFTYGKRKVLQFRERFGLLTEARDDSRDRVEVEGLIIERKKHGTHIVYVIARSSIAKIKEKMGWKDFQDVDPDKDLMISARDFDKVFVAGQSKVDAFKKRYGLLNLAKNDPRDRIEIDGFVFERKKSSGTIVYVVPRSDVSKIAEKMDLKLNENLPNFDSDKDLSVSEPGFEQAFVGGGKKVGAFKKRFGLLAEAKDDKRDRIEAEGLIIQRKQNNSRFIYTVSRDHIDRIAEMMGWNNLSEVDSEKELAITAESFDEVFIGGQTKVDEFKEEFGLLKRARDDVRDRIEVKGLVIERRQSHVAIVYVVGRHAVEEIAKRMGWEFKRDIDEIIEKEGLSSIISELNNDPQMLLGYLLLTTNLDPGVIQQITRRSFEGFRGVAEREIDFAGYRQLEGGAVLKEGIPEKTNEPSVLLEGQVEGDFDQVQMMGDRNKIINVNKDGSFHTRIILRPGEKVNLSIFPVNQENGTMGPSRAINIQQTGKPKSLEEIILALLETKSTLVEQLKKDTTKLTYLRKRLEVNLLSHFTEDEQAGFAYLDEKIIHTTNPLMRRLYEDIRNKFQQAALIDQNALDNVHIEGFNKNERMYFYQKYVIREMLQAIQDYEAGRTKGIPAKVIALEQGLGKTLVSLAIVRGHEQGALVVAPNAVVSTWAQQDAHFFDVSKAVPIIANSSLKKTAQLNEAPEDSIRMVNIEYLRSEQQARFDALNKHPGQLLVLDESQAFSREGTLQSQGAARIKGKYTLLLSATPFANPQAARTLLKFMTHNLGYADADTFNRYLMDDPDSLRLLHFLIDQHVIRIKKKNVFKPYDRSLPLEVQNNRLPEKVYIGPEQLGSYELTMEQANSILELFLDWEGWKQQKEGLTKDRKAVHTQDDRERSTASGNDQYYFAKMHSLRQLANDPHYIGIDRESPKHKKMDEIVQKVVVEGRRKLTIFCAYKEQVKAYEKRYAQYGAVTYYGDTLSDQINADGYLVDKSSRQLRKFRKINEFEYAIDEHGRLIEDPQGDPIKALDYNEYRFQNDPDARVLVTIYEVGGAGKNFTAADAEVFDDLGRDYTVMYQAEDRNNRIDNMRKKYQTDYYRLEARYPQAFLESLKGKCAIVDRETGLTQVVNDNDRQLQEARQEEETVWDLHQLFSRGTYDQIQGYNIMDVQKKEFDLVLDGLEDEDDLNLLSQDQLKVKMPFLFEGTGKKADKPRDLAMAVMPGQAEKGGVDLNAIDKKLQTQSSDGVIKFYIDPAMLEQLQNAPGFVPVIINIEPMADLKVFLGIQ